jgi:hypothetical protein
MPRMGFCAESAIGGAAVRVLREVSRPCGGIAKGPRFTRFPHRNVVPGPTAGGILTDVAPGQIPAPIGG